MAETKREDEEKASPHQRGSWDNQCDFFLSCLGYAVGLGNVWRFPYLCYKHGGGSFLVAYAAMLALAGLPLFFLELAIGQYGGLGPNKLFAKIAPAFKGLGYAMLFVTFLVVIYYNMIMAWVLVYTAAGMRATLPWQDCGNAFNTMECYKKAMAEACDHEGSSSDGSMTYWNNSCVAVKDVCRYYGMTHLPDQRDRSNFSMCSNGTLALRLDQVYDRKSASEDYYTRVVLGLTDDISWENFGELRWQLVLGLFVAWVLVCACLIKGVQSSGKVVYFTSLYPYLVLTILLGKGATLPGAIDGVMFYLTPNWETLESAEVWADAATQIFYSLGPAFGGLITLSSYSRFDNNCHRDAVIVTISNVATSVFAGFVIFSIVGFMAHELDVGVGDVIRSGPGLAFVAYPEAVTLLPVAPLWSFLFFGMLLTLGLDSQFTMVETLTTAIMDEWPGLREQKAKVVVVTSVVGFLLGLPMCCQGGVFVFTLIDWYAASWSILLLALLELILLVYVYGYKTLLRNIAEMEVHLPIVCKFYWLVNWLVLTPPVLLFLILMQWIKFVPCRYNAYVFPVWVQTMGWLMASSSIVIFVAIGVAEYFRRNLILKKEMDVKAMFRPVESWGPASGEGGEGGTDMEGGAVYANSGFVYEGNLGNASSQL